MRITKVSVGAGLCFLLAALIPASLQRAITLSPRDHGFLLFRPNWSPASPQHVTFKFRTANRNALLFHSVVNGKTQMDYAWTLRLVNADLHLSHMIGTSAESLLVAEHLSDNEWHTVTMTQDNSAGTVKIKVDELEEKVQAFSDSAKWVLAEDGSDVIVVYIGGVDSALIHGLDTGVARHQLCIQDVKFATGEKDQPAPEVINYAEIAAASEWKVQEGCQSPCDVSNPCSNGGVCLEQLGKATCDCSSTAFIGPDCSQKDENAITLNGAQYLLYQGGVDSYLFSRISLDFKTHFSHGLIFYTGLRPETASTQLVSISALVVNGQIRIQLDSAHGISKVIEMTGTSVSDGEWHSLEVHITAHQVTVKLDSAQQQLPLGENDDSIGKQLFNFLPVVHVGGFKPLDTDAPVDGMDPVNQKNFVGCLRRVFYGSDNLLEELKSATKRTTMLRDSFSSNHYTEPTYTCEDVKVEELAITLLSDKASVALPEDHSKQIDLHLEFRLLPNSGVAPQAETLISGNLQTQHGAGFFKVFLDALGLVLQFDYPDQSGAMQTTTTNPVGGDVRDGHWHGLSLQWPLETSARQRRQESGSDAETMGQTDETVPTELTSGAVETTLLPETDVTTTDTSPTKRTKETVAPVLFALAVKGKGAANADGSTPEVSADPDVQRIGGSRLTLKLQVGADGADATSGVSYVSTSGQLTLGSSSGSPRGFSGCIRNIRQRGQALDVRQILADQKGDSQDITLDKCSAKTDCQLANPCLHGAKCVPGLLGNTCDCTDTGYTGKTCHFPIYMQTCTDLFLAGERRSGVHIIDLDGSGPIKHSYVYCNMSQQDSQGVTVVGHNFSPTEFKPAKLGGVQYGIQYRQFDRDSLKKLVEVSKTCRQQISYKCKNAPLRLGSHTWFRSIMSEQANITSFGSNSPGKCHCATSGTVCGMGAKKDLACNCDADDSTERVDEGYFTGKEFVGITNMTIVNRNIAAGGHGQLSLGPLECSGKEWIERAVSFISHEGFLSFGTLKDNEDISFFFKTVLKYSVLLYQPGDANHHSLNSLRIAIVNDTTVVLYISINGQIHQLPVSSVKPLNNADWHLVKVEFGHNEVRLTVDLNSNYLAWRTSDTVGKYQGPLYVGGYPAAEKSSSIPTAEPGLIGCIKGLFRGGQSVDVEAATETSGSKEIRRGCQSSCSPNPCANNAYCFDKFGEYECHCANPLAQSGKHCENDINVKAVTFKKGSNSYIQVRTIPDDVDLFHQDVLLNFRTHATTAILFYAHDNFQNFAQLHLHGGRQLLLTFNSGNRIYEAEVQHSGPLNDGKWHQVHVSRQEMNITLTVDYASSDTVILTEAMTLLTVHKQKPWAAGFARLETIVPPRSYYGTLSFKNLYIGGVSDSMTTKLPGFSGCLRGVKVGNHLFDLLGEQETERTTESITDGCKAACDDVKPCKYSGICRSNWGHQDQPTECDCANSSYTGPTCEEDIGANLDGSSRLVIEYKPVLAQNFDLSRPLSFRLAFSTSILPAENVTLLFLQFYQKLSEIVIGLNSEGDVTFDLFTQETSHIRRAVPGNFTNGGRHAVVLSINPKEIIFQVDDQKHIMPLPEDVALTGFIHYVSIGGVELPFARAELSQWKPYSGCISNVIIEAPNQSDVLAALEPLKSGVRQESKQYIMTRFTGDALTEGRCAVPIIPPTIADLPEDAQLNTEYTFPLWEVGPAVPLEFTVAPPKVVDPPKALSDYTAIIVGVVLGVFLLVVLIGVLCYMRSLNKKKKSQHKIENGTDPADPEENVVLMRHNPTDDLEREKSLEKAKVPPNRSNQPFVRPVSKFIDDAILPSSAKTRSDTQLKRKSSLPEEDDRM